MARKKSKNTEVDAIAGITPSKARNAVKVAKVLGPAVIPVVAPYAMQALAFSRDRYERMRARKLGVAVADLGEYSGRGAGLYARINGARSTCNQLSGHREFAERSAATLDQLALAVQAAERMPAPRRRAAHQAVAAELDRMESELLTKLGV